jgi:copper chaperone CopZ
VILFKHLVALSTLRDIVLLLLVLGVLPYVGPRLVNYIREHSWGSSGTLVVEGMCCERAAAQVTAQLARVDGVLSVKPDVNHGLIRLAIRSDAPPSPVEIWQAVGGKQIRPLELSLCGKAFAPRRGG